MAYKFPDQYMCWVSSTAQHAHNAHKEVKGSCSSQLHVAPALLCIGDGWLTEGWEAGVLSKIVMIVIDVNTYRHCNMDYLFLSSIQSTAINFLMISYNICCQWYTNFWAWQKLLPISLQILLPNQALQPLIPKFHLQTTLIAAIQDIPLITRRAWVGLMMKGLNATGMIWEPKQHQRQRWHWAIIGTPWIIVPGGWTGIRQWVLVSTSVYFFGGTVSHLPLPSRKSPCAQPVQGYKMSTSGLYQFQCIWW